MRCGAWRLTYGWIAVPPDVRLHGNPLGEGGLMIYQPLSPLAQVFCEGQHMSRGMLIHESFAGPCLSWLQVVSY